MSLYKIAEACPIDDAEDILRLHAETMGTDCPVPKLDDAFWWLAYFEDHPVAFAGIRSSYTWRGAGYLLRCGVLEPHRGQGLQKRLIRVRERKAVKFGWRYCITDTTENVPSANSLIACGYRLYLPSNPWHLDQTLYWRKKIL